MYDKIMSFVEIGSKLDRNEIRNLRGGTNEKKERHKGITG